MTRKNGDVVSLHRVTVSLSPKAYRDIDYLQSEMGLTKADIVNLAVSNLAFMQRKSKAGREWIMRDEKSQEAELVRFGWELDEDQETEQ